MPATEILLKEQHEQPCPCGCAPCVETSCELDCTVRPRFFCGQLLSDRDLTALVTWTQDKFRLRRFLEGWGVVCGLDVRFDPKRPSEIVVSPGYALACCGDDLVLCEERRLDVSAACAKEKCAALGSTSNVTVQIGPIRVPEREVRVIDLLARYEDIETETQIALTGCGCHPVGECESSRLRESVEIHWRPAGVSPSPEADAFANWKTKFEDCAAIVSQFTGTGAPDVNLVTDQLHRHLEEHPPTEFAFVHELVDGLGAPTESGTAATSAELKRRLAEVLFWIVQDCRNAHAGCVCHECERSAGVPLARVWVRRQEQSRRCRVLAIAAHPPYRRPLRPTCWPTEPGKVNLAQVLWKEPEEARQILAGLGIQLLSPKTVSLPSTVAELRTLLAASSSITAEPGGAPLTAQVLAFELGGAQRRVIGFN